MSRKLCEFSASLQKASCAEAEVEMGKCFHAGKGVEKDQNEAVRLFRRAMQAGNTDAQVELGKCFVRGCGVEKK